MKNRKLTRVLLGAVGLLGFIYHLGANEMLEVKVDIGKNIIETAKQSGAPRWSHRNVDGLISWDAGNFPLDIPVVYRRSGYEISALPIYALTMYANGWKSTEKEAKAFAARKTEIKILEENARKRGDTVIQR